MSEKEHSRVGVRTLTVGADTRMVLIKFWCSNIGGRRDGGENSANILNTCVSS